MRPPCRAQAATVRGDRRSASDCRTHPAVTQPDRRLATAAPVGAEHRGSIRLRPSMDPTRVAGWMDSIRRRVSALTSPAATTTNHVVMRPKQLISCRISRAAAPPSSSPSAPGGSPCRCPSAASGWTASSSPRTWSPGYARSPAAPRSTWCWETCPRAPAPDTYPLVYLVFNTIYNLLTQDDQVRCFENAARHLTTDGVFVVEAGVPSAWLRGNQFVNAERVASDEVVIDVNRYDPVTQILDENHVSLTNAGVRLGAISCRLAHAERARPDGQDRRADAGRPLVGVAPRAFHRYQRTACQCLRPPPGYRRGGVKKPRKDSTR